MARLTGAAREIAELIMGLIQSGRADEVTQEMVDAADGAALRELSGLPMDPVSSARRAIVGGVPQGNLPVGSLDPSAYERVMSPDGNAYYLGGTRGNVSSIQGINRAANQLSPRDLEAFMGGNVFGPQTVPIGPEHVESLLRFRQNQLAGSSGIDPMIYADRWLPQDLVPVIDPSFGLPYRGAYGMQENPNAGTWVRRMLPEDMQRAQATRALDNMNVYQNTNRQDPRGRFGDAAMIPELMRFRGPALGFGAAALGYGMQPTTEELMALEQYLQQ